MKHSMQHRTLRRRTARQLGNTLLEVLVSILIFSFGILGLVGIQARATQLSVDAEDRGRATLLADDLAAQMRLARRVNSLPTAQLDAWSARLADPTGQGLPNGTATIVYDGNTALVTIFWIPPRSPVGAPASQLQTQIVLTTEEVN